MIRAATRSGRVWLLLLPIACWSVLAVGALLSPRFDYNRWDNFEYFTPLITYAHERWLAGRVPLWNPHQQLGEPLLGLGQPGALYAPYTLAVLVRHALGLEPGQLMLVIVAIHVPIGALGWFLLMRTLGVRPSVAGAAALGVVFGGFVTTLATVWIFMLAVSVWLPWILYGMALQLGRGGWVSAIPLVGGLTATALVGHPQMLAYQWLTALLFFVGFAVVLGRPWLMARTALLLGLAVALSLPALLPIVEMFTVSLRARALGLDAFLQDGAGRDTLSAGWLLPWFRTYSDFMPDRGSLLGYQGAWVVPAILAGLVVSRRSRTESTPDTLKCFVVSLGVCAVLTLCALGGATPFYGLTHGIPVWSSMRLPFKFLLLSQPVLLLAAALGVELWMRSPPTRVVIRWIPVALFAAAVVQRAWKLTIVPLGGGADVLGLLAAVATVLAVPYLGRHRLATGVWMAGVFVGACALTASAHDMRMKTYAEPYGRIGARDLGVADDARVLPLTSQGWRPLLMQPLALADSATANGYEGATGCNGGFVVAAFEETLPADVFGVPRPGFLVPFLSSHLLRSFNIGYLVVGSEDRATREVVEGTRRFALIRRDERSATYRVTDVLPRAYFASRSYRYTPDGWRSGLLDNRVPVDSAFIEAWDGPEAGPVGRVLATRWDADRATIEVDAPAGGFLVVAISFYDGWTAAVDGRAARVERVNRRVMGVTLPPGARRVTLEFRSPALRRGIVLGLSLTAVLGAVLAVWSRAASARAARAGACPP